MYLSIHIYQSLYYLFTCLSNQLCLPSFVCVLVCVPLYVCMCLSVSNVCLCMSVYVSVNEFVCKWYMFVWMPVYLVCYLCMPMSVHAKTVKKPF